METYEQLRAFQKQHIQTSAQGEYHEIKDLEKQVLQPMEVGEYDSSFVEEETKSQRQFYEEYRQKWNRESDAHKTLPPATVPHDVITINGNVRFWQKYTRKKAAKAEVKNWKRRLEKLDPAYDQTKVYDAEQEKERQHKITTVHGLSIGQNVTANTIDLMKGTVRLAEIENRKKKILAEEKKKRKKSSNPVFDMFEEQIMALAPPLMADDTDTVNQQVVISQESEQRFRDFIGKALEDPIGMAKKGILDAVHTYGEIPMKLLESDAFPKKFEYIKQLRDRYKAVHLLLNGTGEYVQSLQGKFDEQKRQYMGTMSSEELKKGVDDSKIGIYKMLQDAKSMNEMIKGIRRDTSYTKEIGNYKVATEVYRRLDLDLRYSLENNGIKFRDNGTFLDRIDVFNERYKRDGVQTKALFKVLHEKKQDKLEQRVQDYWNREISELLTSDRKEQKKGDDDKDEKEDKKQEKKKDDFKDDYNIKSAVDQAEEYKYGLDDEKKAIFERAASDAKKIARAVYDIDVERESAKDIEVRKAKDLNARPALKRRIGKYLDLRQQQQVDLMDRAAAYINVLRYLAGKADLTANGSRVLRELAYKAANEQRKKQQNPDDDIQPLGTQDTELQLRGLSADVATLSRGVPTFEQKKAALLEQHKNNEKVDELKKDLEKPEAKLKLDYLMLTSNISLGEISFGILRSELTNDINPEVVKVYLAGMRKNFAEQVNKIIYKVDNGNIDKLSVVDRANTIKDYMGLRDKILAFNRMMDANIPGVQKKTFKDLLQDGMTEDEKKIDNAHENTFKIKSKILFDLMERFRIRSIIQGLDTDNLSDEMCTEAEHREMDLAALKAKKKDGKYEPGRGPEALRRAVFEKKLEAQELVLRGHRSELTKHREQNPEILPLEKELEEAGKKKAEQESNTTNLEAFSKKVEDKEKAEVEYAKREAERKEREQKEKEEREEREKQEKKEREEQEKREKEEKEKKEREEAEKREKLDKVIQGLKDAKKNVTGPEVKPPKKDQDNPVYTKEEIARFEKKYDKLPDLTDNKDALTVTKSFFQKLMLSKSLQDISEDAGKITEGFKSADTKNSNLPELVKALYTVAAREKGALASKEILKGDMSIRANSVDFIWLMNEVAACKSYEEIGQLRTTWNMRNNYLFGQGFTVDSKVHEKGDALLDCIFRARDFLDKQTTKQSFVKSLDQYVTPKDKKLDGKFDLKQQEGGAQTFNFDQHQQGSNLCWGASHTYVVNSYMKVHKMTQDAFTQATFKDIGNFVTHPKLYGKIDWDREVKPDEESLEGEAHNIVSFLTEDKKGNPYSVADVVLDRLPKTAEHHVVYTGSFLSELQGDELTKAKEKLSVYFVDKIESELRRTGAPISILRGVHYLSIVGVDKAGGRLLTMNSQNDGEHLNDVHYLDIADLVGADKFELVFPEYLDEQNMSYLTDKFGLRKDLYDKNGDMVDDEQMQTHKEKMLERPANMLHVHGVEFDRQQTEYDFEKQIFEEQIYMPTSLDLPAKLKKDKKE